MAEQKATPTRAPKVPPMNEAHQQILDAAKLIAKGAKGMSLAELVRGRQMLNEGLNDFVKGLTAGASA
ncbi:MAG: hypothetical protein ACYCSN_19810 [Acidobacteriaceae bacterium]